MKIFCISVLIFILAGNVAPLLSQEEGEEVGQSIIDVLNTVLPPNPKRIIELDEKTGRLFIQDTPSNHKIIKDVILALDKEPAQVTIETRFVELKFTDEDEFGLHWGRTFVWYDFTRDLLDPASAGQREARWRFRGIDPSTRTIGNLITFSTSTSGGLDLSLAKLSTNQLDFFIHALEKNDKANLLSSPKVTTISGQLANIQITTTVPYIADDDITFDSVLNTAIHNYDVKEILLGIKLEVKPTVGEGDIITLELHPEVETLVDRLTMFTLPEGASDMGWPVVDTRSSSTTVQVKSGETIVLGGLMDDNHKVIDKKVPVLGDIPLIGNLFRNKYTKRIKKNLLVFVTATLVNPAGEETRQLSYSSE